MTRESTAHLECAECGHVACICNPPIGAYICGGSWEELSPKAREELHVYAEYLRTTPRAHGGFRAWLTARRAAPERQEEGRDG